MMLSFPLVGAPLGRDRRAQGALLQVFLGFA